MQRWALSDDRQRLTTTDVQILFGEPRTVEQLEWRRVGGAAKANAGARRLRAGGGEPGDAEVRPFLQNWQH